jgi:Tol biopolymer transport system component
MPVERGSTCFLYRADIATGVAHRLTHATAACEYFPAFSPDGQHLTFTSAPRRGAHGAVMLANADGTAARPVVPDDADNLAPTFVPHTNQIAFVRSGAFEHHSPLVTDHRDKYDIYAVDPSTTQITRLTNQQFYDLSGFSISPDGRQLVLTVFDTAGTHFLVSPLDSPEVRRQSLKPASFVWLSQATWMPDGQSLLFIGGARPPSGGPYGYDLYRLTVQSGAVDRLTHASGRIDGYSVSLDGTKVVILRGGQLTILDLRTQALTPLPVTIRD